MGTHTGPTAHWVEAGWSRLTVALWGHTLDQQHTGLRQVDSSSMGTHTGPTAHWVEAGWSRLTVALWGHTLDQQHTGLRQVEVG